MTPWRRVKSVLVLLPLLVAVLGSAQIGAEDAPDTRLIAGRTISAKLGAELRAALEKALAEKGPVAAIAVCKEEAPRIAARLSAANEATVSRTSLRIRNSANTPKPWQL